jgi:hypothetical protein
MTLAIKIGAGAQIYDNVAVANSMRGNQRLSITGTGEEIKAELASGSLITYAANISSIKSTNDLNLNVTEIGNYKAALVKLGTRSIVLASGTTASNVQSNFTNLDAVYTKIKSLTISDASAPTILVSDLANAVNLKGLATLSGKIFNVNGTDAQIEANMASLLKNISNVGTITINSGQLDLTSNQLAIIGDKLLKTGGATVALKDTADNILTTSSLAMIAKLNNSNIQSSTSIVTNVIAATNGAADNTTGIITVGAVNFNTGDGVTFTGANVAAGAANGDALAQNSTVYVRKLSSTTMQLFDTYAHAVDLTSTVGYKNTTVAMSGTLQGQAGNAPTRNVTLDRIDVTSASVSQANRLKDLTEINTGTTSQGYIRNRLTADIINSIQIKDTATNLMDVANNVSISAGTLNGNNTTATRTTKGDFTSGVADNGFKTGDAVTYTANTDGTAYANLISGNTYYVGMIAGSTNNFVLFDTKAKALTQDLTSVTTAATGANARIDVGNAASGSGSASTHTFKASTLDKLMSSVGRFSGGSGSVTRVTISGNGSESSTTLNDIATKALRGYSTTQVTYAGKGVEIQKNIQALYDNISSTDTGVKKLTEIVVTDGTSTGKKLLTMSEVFYTAMKTVFARGVDQGVTPAVNKNYSYNVTNAAVDLNNPTTLQNDANVSSYSVVGAQVSQLTGHVITGSTLNGDDLRIMLGMSKLKTMTSTSGISVSDRSTITSLLNAIGSNTDRAKLKLIA